MSLNFQNAGDYAKAVYGDANSQHVGSNGAIAMNNVSSVGMKGGKNKNQSKKNQSKKNQRGGNNKSKKNQSKKNQSKKNQSKKNQSKKNQQKGGKWMRSFD